MTGNLIQNSACPVTLSFNYDGTTYSKTITVNVAARVPVSMSTRWFGHDEGYVLPVYLGTSAETLKDGIVATLLYSDGYTEQTTDISVSGDIPYRHATSPITVIYNETPAITSVIYAYGEINLIERSASVLYLLEGCTATNTQSYAPAGEVYSSTISAASGSVYSIKVLIDGIDSSVRVVSGNNITIPGENIIAGSNIIIIAENTADFSVAYHLSNCSSTNTVTSIAKGTPYLTEIQPDPGYTIDASQTKAIMNGDEYFYSESSRTITVMNVRGNIDVYGVAVTPSVETYTVSNHLTNCVSSNSATSVDKGSSYTATITANAGYTLDGIVVTMSGTAITSSVVSGNNISIPEVTGNVVITATASETPTADVSYESATKTLTIKTLPSDPSYDSGTKTLTIS